MDHARCQRLVDIIVCGKTFINEKTADGTSISLILDSPNPTDRAKAALIYEQVYAEALDMGLLTEDELIISYIEMGQWDAANEIKIADLKTDIHNIRKGLLDLLFHVIKLERSRALLRNAESVLVDILVERHGLLDISAEHQSLLRQQRYIIGMVTKTSNGELYWKTAKAFDEETDIMLINRLSIKYYQDTRIDSKAIRELARSSPWRTTWSSSKDMGDLFGCPIIALSDSQRDLTYWSHMYDMVYEAYERPTTEIIEDDDLLDSWFIRQSDKMDDQSKKNFGLKDPKSTKPGRKEMFVMSDAEGAKKVYDMNDPTSRAKIKARQAFIKKNKKVQEQDLPESQMEMRTIAMDQMRKSISKR